MKLILFDIDGTLIYHVGKHPYQNQYELAIQETFGVTAGFDMARYNGTLDRHNSWDAVREMGITRKEFLKKFPTYINNLHRIMTNRAKEHTLYEPIDSAVSFVKTVHSQKDIALGVITGNAKRIARWKLDYTGLSGYFPFGLYGDEADDRARLAKLVFAKAKKELKLALSPQDITVIGDTVFDIRCGKAIEAKTIAVTTGHHVTRDMLAAEQPDLIVDSLMDPRVLSLVLT